MIPSYQWVRTSPSVSSNARLIDIMGAPIQDTNQFKKECKICENTTLCISGELKEIGEGIPASNYRFKNDKDKNKNVIRNYQYLFQQFKKITKGKPILITTIPRSLRILSFHILENGQITCKSNSEEINGALYSNSIEKMLQKYNITQKNMIQIRESCSGSKYNTYLIDMISFLYQIKMDTPEFHEIFDSEYRNVISILGKNIPNGNGKYEEDISYMFMNKTSCNKGYIFFRPTLKSIPLIYKEFLEAINLSDNDTKRKIRSHCCHYNIERWTDFDVNDTDDAFTILMIFHAFHYGEGPPSVQEKIIFTQLEYIIQQWSSQLE
mgnify:CR=1 FL=1